MDWSICNRSSTVAGSCTGIDSFQVEVMGLLEKVVVVAGNCRVAAADDSVEGEDKTLDAVEVVVEVALVVETVACPTLKGRPKVTAEMVVVGAAAVADNAKEEHCIAVVEVKCRLFVVVASCRLAGVVVERYSLAGVAEVLCNHERMEFGKKVSCLTIVGAEILDLMAQSDDLRCHLEIPTTFGVPPLCFAQIGLHCLQQKRRTNQGRCRTPYPSLILPAHLSRRCMPF